MRKIRMSRVTALLVAALSAGACADNARSPVGPSAVNATAMVGSSIDVDRSLGTVDRESAAEWALNSGWMTVVDGQMVAGIAVIGAMVSGTCPDRVFTARGVPVSINSGTTFGPGVTCAALAAGVTVHIAGLLTMNGGAYALIATAITVDQPREDGTGGGPGRISGEGTVAAIRGTCPAMTMLIRGYAVMTSEDTVYTGGTCASLRPGVKVLVSGVNQANSLGAETVEFIQ